MSLLGVKLDGPMSLLGVKLDGPMSLLGVKLDGQMSLLGVKLDGQMSLPGVKLSSRYSRLMKHGYQGDRYISKTYISPNILRSANAAAGRSSVQQFRGALWSI